jgi:type VI secretion system protein
LTQELKIVCETTREERRITAGQITIGRGQGNEWVLPDDAPEPTLSRRHCRIQAAGGGFTLADLGSTNGTRLNGSTLPAEVPTPLQAGDIVEIGAHRLTITLETPRSREMSDMRPAPRSLEAEPGDPFGLGVGSGPAGPLAAAPRPSPPGAGDERSLDDIFGGWGSSGAQPGIPSTPRPAPGPIEDPLAGLFREELDPLPKSRPADPDPGAGMSEAGGAPQFEAWLSRRARPAAAAEQPGQSGSPPPPPAEDPFGLMEQHGAPRPSAPLPPPLPAAADTLHPPSARPAPPARQTPTEQAPAPGPARVQEGSAAEDRLVSAFLDGAGVGDTLKPEDHEAFLRDAGRAFAQMAEGLRELLTIRATVKDHARLDRTQIGAVENNPLKFSIGAREATAALLQLRAAGYLPPSAAIDASFRDLKAHELALLEGLQSAVSELLGSFDPGTLEQRLEDSGALSLFLQGGRRAKLWELYTDRYEEIARSAKARFMGHFDGAFRQAYERKTAEIAASGKPPPRESRL